MRTRNFFAFGTALLALTGTAFANGELNGDASVVNGRRDAAASKLPATVVVRVNNQDKSVAVMQSKKVLAGNAASAARLNPSKFVSVDPTKRIAANELNHDSSTDSWFFSFNNYNYSNYYGYSSYYPTYSYLGYNYAYQPYYNYSYGGYSYYYYNYPQFNYGYTYPAYNYGQYNYGGNTYNNYYRSNREYRDYDDESEHHHRCNYGC